jgi:hypothetical protein
MFGGVESLCSRSGCMCEKAASRTHKKNPGEDAKTTLNVAPWELQIGKLATFGPHHILTVLGGREVSAKAHVRPRGPLLFYAGTLVNVFQRYAPAQRVNNGGAS